jgi:hypothetical protein
VTRKEKMRLDALLVERGLAPTRSVAVGCILAGRVFSGERRLDKPGAALALDAPLSLRELPRYVSRGGVKLEGALATLDEQRVEPHFLLARHAVPGAPCAAWRHALRRGRRECGRASRRSMAASLEDFSSGSAVRCHTGARS